MAATFRCELEVDPQFQRLVWELAEARLPVSFWRIPPIDDGLVLCYAPHLGAVILGANFVLYFINVRFCLHPMAPP